MSNVTHSCQLPLHGYGGFGKCLDTLDHARLPELMKRERDVSSFFSHDNWFCSSLMRFMEFCFNTKKINKKDDWNFFPGFSYHKKYDEQAMLLNLERAWARFAFRFSRSAWRVKNSGFFLFLFDVGNPSKIEKKLLFEKRRNKFVQQPLFFFSGQTFFWGKHRKASVLVIIVRERMFSYIVRYKSLP